MELALCTTEQNPRFVGVHHRHHHVDSASRGHVELVQQTLLLRAVHQVDRNDHTLKSEGLVGLAGVLLEEPRPGVLVGAVLGQRLRDDLGQLVARFCVALCTLARTAHRTNVEEGLFDEGLDRSVGRNVIQLVSNTSHRPKQLVDQHDFSFALCARKRLSLRSAPT